MECNIIFQVTGASLGGSMASLGAGAIRTVVGPTADIRLVTFGQPRTGNIFYALSHDQAVGISQEMRAFPPYPSTRDAAVRFFLRHRIA